MTNKDLIAKLNNLNKINPDQTWLESNRELLLSQISNAGAENISLWKNLLINLSSLSKVAVQPAYALAAFVVLLISGFWVSQPTLSYTKPNNSLYIARIIAEKVKLNTTFNSQERDKLAVQYATDHAQDITAVLADPKFNTPANKEQVAQLNTSFNQEVNTVKSGISRLVPAAVKPLAGANTAAPKLAVKNSNEATASDLIIADSSKDKSGLQLLEKDSSSSETIKSSASSKDTVSASTTDASSSSQININNPGAADQILDEAQKLFDQKNYNQASDKLKEVDKIIQ
jgi:hypothetical protein